MQDKRSLTLNGLTIPNFLFLLLSLGMVGVSIYLTNYYFDSIYPQGIGQGSSLCNISDFFTCDQTTRSVLGNIWGIPTSFFGIIIGLLGIVCAFSSSEALERTTKLIYLINAAGCLILLIFSIAVLGSLCPMCTAYYVLSFLALAMLFKHSHLGNQFEMTSFASFAVAFLVFAGGMKFYVNGKEEAKVQLAKSYISQFNGLKDYGDPGIESPFKINMATENFSDAPIRISIFSDFQCPYCKAVADQVPQILAEFKEHVNIQYLFYPLDSACNEKMKGGMHPYACQAAYLAACDKEKFAEIHDHIFEKQQMINSDNLKKWEADYNLSGCFENEEVKGYIKQTLNAGVQYNLRSTPTIIINGKKIEGLIPMVHLREILKSLIK